MRPTQSELIERIEQCYLGDDVPNRVYELLHDILCHLTTLSAAHTIKPLVWEKTSTDPTELWETVNKSIWNYAVWMVTDGTWRASYKNGSITVKCDSLAHGKQLCQQHWESEAGIGKYLERVK